MNLHEFIDWLFMLYPNSWTSENKLIKMRQFKFALKDPRIDFLKLQEVIANEHKDNFMPTSGWLNEKSVNCLKRAEYVYVTPVVYSKTLNKTIKSDAFEANTTEEEIKKTYENLIFPHVSDWEIQGYL